VEQTAGSHSVSTLLEILDKSNCKLEYGRGMGIFASTLLEIQQSHLLGRVYKEVFGVSTLLEILDAYAIPETVYLLIGLILDRSKTGKTERRN
jgi:hypothetical protein